MPDHVLDLVIISPSTDDEDWTFYSPQMPGLVGGRDSLLQLRADLPEILRFAEVSLPVKIRTHVEQVYEAGGTEYIVRVAQDGHLDDRLAAVRRLHAALTIDDQREDLLSSPRTRTGEVLFIAAVASDTVRDIAAQLHPSGDAAVVVGGVADQFVWTFHLTNAEDLDEAARPLGALGLSENTSIGEIMRSRPAGSPAAALLAG